MDGNTNPFEAGLGWAVKLSKDFIGKSALQRLQKEGLHRYYEWSEEQRTA